ncbi:MAG TPA: NADH-quinone oxidoreductase subunit N [Candidatus Tyrphobacter sp.]
MSANVTNADWAAVLPIALLAATGLVVLVVDLLARTFVRRYVGIGIAAIGAIGTGVLVFLQFGTHGTAFGGAFVVDDASLLFQGIVLAATLGSVVLYGAIGENRHVAGALALMLWSACGAMLMSGAGNLMTIFLGLELLSLALYALCGMAERKGAHEAALKYLILSSTATGFLLYGMALLFGATGSVALSALSNPALGTNATFWIGVGLFFVGVAFKLSLVPFHTWAPDVYEGAPLPVTAFMSVATKAGVLAVLVRVFLWSLPSQHASALLLPVWIVAGISMIVGNVGMLSQRDLKRMLAYSGIAQIGYILTALAGGAQGLNAALYYFVAYSFMNLGAFAVAAMLSGEGEEGSLLANFSGLGYRRPWAAFAMTVLLLAMAGLPPTAGFLGKVLILRSSVATGYVWLGVLLIAGTAISLYAYGRIVRAMYDRVEHPVHDARPFVPLAAISAAICTIAVIALTFYPFTR